MIKSRPFFFLLILSGIVLACEDVIEVAVPTTKPRLIVDALMRVDTTQQFFDVAVKVSETTNFFEEIAVTTLEEATMIFTTTRKDGLVLGTGVVPLMEVNPGSGVYVLEPGIETATVLGEDDVLFTLILEHKGRKYAAQTRYVPAAEILDVVQGSDTLFDDEETEVVITFKDDSAIDNFYIFDLDFNKFLVSEDAFYNGQEFQFSYFYDKNLNSGQEVTISILGADRTFYNYMDELITQSEQPQGPFQTPVSTVRGNVFDITGLDNINIVDNAERPNDFPLGYFGIVQEFKKTITIQ
ncbi:DUF4249 family protein [Maribacter sp. 2307UL18-2]|uniref:DUF4249 family protein n=1 Tax=Maribacter sp. 2307UL18-2 TaxID=3386274 RepID=UPI0039BD06FA